MGNEELYLKAEREFDSDVIDQGLRSKSKVECEGDLDRAKYRYIQHRVEQLEREKGKERTQTVIKSMSSGSTKIFTWITKYLVFCGGMFLIFLISKELRDLF